jgi:carbon-monoxide dehydrogenase large subunit
VEQARRLEQREAPRLIGIGVPTYVEITNGIPSPEYARVEVASDGTLVVHSGTSPHGQGHHTTWAMIAAEQLGIPLERIRFVTGDTDSVPRGVGTFGSRSAQTGVVAVHLAATEVRARARDLAANLL